MSQLVECPDCSKHLQVPDNLLGKKVQCPECKSTFTAAAPDEAQTAMTSAPAKPMPSPNLPAKVPAWEKKPSTDDDDDSPSPRRKRDDDERDDEVDDRDRPRRSRGMGRGRLIPHRGGMILAFGLISLLTSLFIFGIIAWVMGNTDLAEIRAGRMETEGEGMTQAGRILGIVSVVLWILFWLLFLGYIGCIFGLMLFVIGAAAQNQNPGPNRRR